MLSDYTKLDRMLDAASNNIATARKLASRMGRGDAPSIVTYEDYVSAAWPHLGAEVSPAGVTGPLGPHGILGYDWRGKTPSGRHATTPGTFWPFGKMIWTADHVIEEMFGNIPPFCAGMAMLRRPGGQDVCIFGVDAEIDLPPMPKPGDRILIEGVTGGTNTLDCTFATVYMQRPGETGFIARQDDDTPLVEKGRSGGRVSLVKSDRYIPYGHCNIQSAGNVDSDGDGDDDRHMDFEPCRPALIAARRQWAMAA